MTEPLWTLVDFSGLLLAEFYGAARRDPAPAVLGAAARARRLARDSHRVVWCLDRAPYARTSLLPDYKGNRPADPDRDRLRAFCETLPEMLAPLGGPVAWAGGYEADDHVAAAVAALPDGHRAMILSADRDLHQLLRPHVAQFNPTTCRVYTHGAFRAEWNLHPADWAAVRALAGDATDNIRGTPGAAERTAARYLNGSLPMHHAVYMRLQEFDGGPDFLRNLALVSLPFPGTPPVRLRESAPAPGSWATFAERLGAPGRVEGSL